VTTDIHRAKRDIRERVWALLEQQRITEPGVRGYIPAFAGAAAAAALLASLPEWQTARAVKIVPDRAQAPVREQALREGKLLYMPVPRLAEDPPFCLLDPARLAIPAADAAYWQNAVKSAPRVTTGQMKPVDMIVCGSVAVNRAGTRLGKGAGYSDIEVALLTEAGLISPRTVIVTTVHPLQVLEDPIPQTAHDFSVDLIVTTNEVIRCQPSRRPTGLNWETLPGDMIAAIPVLAARAALHGR
jgi:5-formyltetrahydrofolate cyclo-ligase